MQNVPYWASEHPDLPETTRRPPSRPTCPVRRFKAGSIAILASKHPVEADGINLAR